MDISYHCKLIGHRNKSFLNDWMERAINDIKMECIIVHLRCLQGPSDVTVLASHQL